MVGDEPRRLESAWKDSKLGRFNLAVLGATGVGKSTLINACFDINDAATGVGAPVTEGVDYFTNADETLGLYDFRGAESYSALQDFLRNFRMHYQEKLQEDSDHVIHGVWYCIKASDRRWDNQQSQIVRELAELGLPVLVVITQTPYRPELGIPEDVTALIDYVRSRDLPIVTGSPIPVAAKDDPFTGTRAYNLERLLKESFDAAPKGVQAAFAAAQKVDLELKKKAATKAIALASATAAGTPWAPIPVPDAVLIAPIQVGMMARIAKIYSVELLSDAIVLLVTQLIAANFGKAAASFLAKFVPVAGPVLNGTVAAALTGCIGRAWAELCRRHFVGEIDIRVLIEDGELGRTLLDLASNFVRKPGRDAE